MKEVRYYLFLTVLAIVIIVIGAALYAAWDTFKATAIDTIGFFGGLLRIAGVIVVAGLVAFIGLFLWRKWQERHTQTIGPGRFGPAQAILDRKSGMIYYLPTRVFGRNQLPEPQVIAGTIVAPDEDDEELLALPAPKQPPTPRLPDFVRYEDIATRIPPDHALVGIDERGVVTRNRAIKALIWVVGSSGTGKTNTVALRVEEDYQRGHWFLLIDPHWFKGDSLYNAIKGYADRLLLPMASEPEDIIKVLDAFLNEFKRRRAGEAWKHPITIIIDEVGSLVSDKPENDMEAEMIAKIKQVARICGQESRGFGMTGMFISQDAAGLAWLRKRAIMVLAHQLLMMSERLLACNNNAEIARAMDTWPIGRTLVYGIGFKEGQRVVQQPVFAPRVVEADPPSRPANQGFPTRPPEDRGRQAEAAQEGAGRDGRDIDVTQLNNPLMLKKFLNEAGKMRAKGRSIDAMLKEFGLPPGGRNNQNLKALLDAREEVSRQQQDEDAEEGL